MSCKWITAAVLTVTTTLSHAEVVQLEVSSDNTLFQSEAGGISSGAGDRLFAGVTNAGELRRALLRFDLSASVPAAANVTAASVRLTLDRQGPAGPAMLNLHRVLAAWGEGTSAGSGGGAPATTGDATWTHRFHATTTWNLPGGDFDPSVLVAATMSGIGNQAFAGPEFISAVQGWIAVPEENFGLIIKEAASVSGNSARFHSRESADPAARPLLSVTFDRPISSWNIDADGTWDDDGNWSDGAPASFGTIARFGGSISSPRTVSVPVTLTAGQLEFDSASPYTLAGTGPIHLDNGVGFDARVDVLSGLHSVDTRVVSAGRLRLNIESSSTLHLGELEVASSVLKSGAGTLVLGLASAGQFDLESGATKLASPTSFAVSGLSIAVGASLDLNHSGFIQSAGSGQIDGEFSARLLDIEQGRLSTSDAELVVGIATASDLPGMTSFLGRPVPESSILVRATIVGDGNLDGAVNFDDLLTLAQNYGTLTGANWVDGDSNRDGTVGFDDLLALAQKYGSSLGLDGRPTVDGSRHAAFDSDWQLARSIVPEPVGFTAVIVLCLAGRRRVD